MDAVAAYPNIDNLEYTPGGRDMALCGSPQARYGTSAHYVRICAGPRSCAQGGRSLAALTAPERVGLGRNDQALMAHAPRIVPGRTRHAAHSDPRLASYPLRIGSEPV